jgi:hypothetical protein
MSIRNECTREWMMAAISVMRGWKSFLRALNPKTHTTLAEIWRQGDWEPQRQDQIPSGRRRMRGEQDGTGQDKGYRGDRTRALYVLFEHSAR